MVKTPAENSYLIFEKGNLGITRSKAIIYFPDFVYIFKKNPEKIRTTKIVRFLNQCFELLRYPKSVLNSPTVTAVRTL